MSDLNSVSKIHGASNILINVIFILFQEEKYKDVGQHGLDLFKECHYSKKKKAFAHVVQSAIVSNWQLILYALIYTCTTRHVISLALLG